MDSLASLSINPIASVSHPHADSRAEWKQVLLAQAATPPNFSLLKTLVFKPKTAKTNTTTPVFVITRDETETSSAILSKLLKIKELRLASPDLLKEFFSLDKDSLSPLALSKDSFPKVLTVLDSSIISSQSPFAVHAQSSSSTLFLTGQDIQKYLESLQTNDVKFQVIDFATLAPSTDPPIRASEPAAKEKGDAQIEGAVQIAIGVKKEVDFAAWYTNVLIKADMLDYYSVSGCYILKPWSYSIWEEIQNWFNGQIKELGVQNAYFPMFVSSKVLQREKDHIEGFSPEVAWVTKA